jgi:hypothetical protein
MSATRERQPVFQYIDFAQAGAERQFGYPTTRQTNLAALRSRQVAHGCMTHQSMLGALQDDGT